MRIAGGPSSLTIVPTALHAPSSEQLAPPWTVIDAKMCSSSSIVALLHTVMLTLKVPFGVLGGMEKGTLVKGTKSTPAVQDDPATGALKPTPDMAMADTTPVTVSLWVPTKRTGSRRMVVPALPSNTLASSTNMNGSCARAVPVASTSARPVIHSHRPTILIVNFSSIVVSSKGPFGTGTGRTNDGHQYVAQKERALAQAGD